MCGRTVQTQGAVMVAASSLMAKANGNCWTLQDDIGDRVSPENESSSHIADEAKNDNAQHDDEAPSDPKGQFQQYPWRDNYNLSPGHDAVVFTMNSDNGNHQLRMDRKIWGLVPKGGTTKAPLPTGPSQHFANLMFNARSDTLFSKPTFSRLLGQGKTCLIAVDGFFEWKNEAMGSSKGKKQPYYVYRNNSQEHQDGIEKTTTSKKRGYLLMAGLWTSVPTGRSEQPTLDTFTILTTEVCSPLSWLHTRMPVCIWDEQLALEWLQRPSQSLHQALDTQAQTTRDGCFQSHAVTTQMSSTKFRSSDSIKALPKPKTVTSFFAPASKASADSAKAVTTATTTQKKNKAATQEQTDKETNDEDNAGSSTAKEDKSPSDFFTKKRPAPWFSPTGSAKKSASKQSSSAKAHKTASKSSPASEKKGSITSFFAAKSKK